MRGHAHLERLRVEQIPVYRPVPLCHKGLAGAQGEEGTDSEGASYLLVQAHYPSAVVTDLSKRHLQQPFHQKILQRGQDEHRE